jgi:hypothetical protein
MTSNSNPWFYCPQPKPQARLRLFCFPYAGGGIVVYRTWPNHLPPDVEVCAIQLPGRDSRLRESPFVHLPGLINALAEGLTPKLTQPYAFFGQAWEPSLRSNWPALSAIREILRFTFFSPPGAHRVYPDVMVRATTYPTMNSLRRSSVATTAFHRPY